MARIEKEMTLVKESSYERRSFSGYGYETVHIYKLSDGDITYVWKTTAFLEHDTIKDNGDVEMYFPERGDVLRIRATVKGESEYKGEMQTEINRVKVVEVIRKDKEIRIAKQRDSMKQGDWVWKGMTYAQYKKSYSDCEIVIDSYNDHENREPATVDVIIRAGRLKPSGVRGEKFAYYCLENENGDLQTYKATCEGNALRRAKKEHGGVWSVKHIEDCYRGGFRDIWR